LTRLCKSLFLKEKPWEKNFSGIFHFIHRANKSMRI